MYWCRKRRKTPRLHPVALGGNALHLCCRGLSLLRFRDTDAQMENNDDKTRLHAVAPGGNHKLQVLHSAQASRSVAKQAESRVT